MERNDGNFEGQSRKEENKSQSKSIIINPKDVKFIIWLEVYSYQSPLNNLILHLKIKNIANYTLKYDDQYKFFTWIHITFPKGTSKSIGPPSNVTYIPQYNDNLLPGKEFTWTRKIINQNTYYGEYLHPDDFKDLGTYNVSAEYDDILSNIIEFQII